MRLAMNTWQPMSNWTTAVLLTLVITGFGLFAQHRANAGAHAIVAGQPGMMVTPAGNK